MCVPVNRVKRFERKPHTHTHTDKYINIVVGFVTPILAVQHRVAVAATAAATDARSPIHTQEDIHRGRCLVFNRS